MARAADEEMIGRNVAGKFLVEKFLGGGAMGAVYKAYQRSIEKHVAIKVLHREFGAEQSFVSRFEREAKAASLLDHGNLMRVIDYGREPDGVCYIAMELLEGRSLYQVIKDDAPLGDERIAGLVRQTLAGLAVAHEMGIIHRDLKPENIIVLEKFDDDGNRAELVKVCDFGMAKLVTPETDAQGPLSSEKLTSHGVVVGTPDYMSPEQGKGERLDARSDLYAVGVILYQMLTGKLPFSADTPIATLLRHVIDEPTPPSEIAENVHPGLESVCLRALAKRREDRFQTAREMRAELRTVMEGRGNSMPSAMPPARRALGSVSDDGFAAFDLRPPGLPKMGLAKSLDLPPPRAIAHTPPQSHRIRASEVLRPEPAPSRKWLAPLLFVLVAAGATGAFFVRKHRAVAQAHASVARAPTESAAPAASTSSRTDTPLSPPTGIAATEPAPPSSTEPKGGSLPAYGAPTSASLAVRGGVKTEPAPSAGAPAPSTTSSFGVLAVPEVPKIEGAVVGASTATAPPVASGASSPSPSPAPPDAFAHARVTLGSVHAEKVAASDVLAALPAARFNRCYKTGLVAKGSNVGGQGSLRLTIDSVGHIGGASFAGTAELASIGQCIAEAAVGADVKHVESGVTGAEIDLSFQPE
jgi:serine/threonine protein kinase